MTDPAAAAALAAAVAAAAEIAKNTPLFYSTKAANETNEQPSKDDKPSTVTGATKNAKHFTKRKRKEEEDDEDAEKRLARSRERNREHARRTRLRKKAQLEALQLKVTELQDEGRVLKQSIEECSIASILVGLSSGSQHTATDSLLNLEETKSSPTVSAPKVTRVGKRKRFVIEDGDKASQPLMLNVEGKMTLFGAGKGHINWKSGVYADESGVQRQLSPEQLESLRRERNRMHAKMTRDRKKTFISSVEKTIQQLEEENERMREVLGKVAGNTPLASPKVVPSITPDLQDVDVAPAELASKLNEHVSKSFRLE